MKAWIVSIGALLVLSACGGAQYAQNNAVSWETVQYSDPNDKMDTRFMRPLEQPAIY